MIKSVKAREILDSRGNPTVEVDIVADSSLMGRAAVPSGASVGSQEALELRDGGDRYHGKGVLKAVENVNSIIAKELQGRSFESLEQFDRFLIELDGTVNKSRLGANALLGCSMAMARLIANEEGVYLFETMGDDYRMPRPMMNILNGGVHADNGLAIQEFMIVPTNYESIRESVRMGSEIFHTLKKILKKKGLATGVGDEGGFAPRLSNTLEALDLISEAVEASGYKLGVDVNFALDCAASEFFQDGKYLIDGEQLSPDELIDYYSALIGKYPIISIEDPFSEFDRPSWKAFTEVAKERVQIVGDDLFVTNPIFLEEGIRNHLANAILIKLNQIGTVSETLATIDMAHSNGFNSIVSHRSGETEDAFIAHLAVASGSWQIKTGSLCRSDRTCKYNELIRIEEILNTM